MKMTFLDVSVFVKKGERKEDVIEYNLMHV